MADPHHFEFDLDLGIQQQVVEHLERSPILPLAEGVGPRRSGIYALYYRGDLVYVGKASALGVKGNPTLRSRLGVHRRKIEGRQNITLSDMQCRFLTFSSEWWVWAGELSLIEHYDPTWNGSGFGSNVPGRGRQGTERVSRWNEQFPPK
ncbi:MAG: Eco29kI family restriction endonuclease [bacterium]|nr:Eco29kI family restriction endonuclease [Dehalococcoidia bacterium]MDE0215758.1 Eco29kI family restriction endonuclease [bacterium]